MTLVSVLLVIIIIFAFLYRRKIKVPFISQPEKYMSLDDKYNSDKREREKEIDLLLSKMGKNGLSDLSLKDRKRLDELSKN